MVPPARILDTRDGTGAVPVAPLGPGATLDIQVTGRGGVPASGVTAVILNATVTNTSAPGYLTIYPAGVTRPLSSNLNWIAGQAVPNLVVVAPGTGGKVTVYNSQGSTDVILDVFGYVLTSALAPGPDGLFNPLAPARLLDTRDPTGGFTALGAGATISLQVTGRGKVPATGVSAVVLNVTATNATTSSYVVAWAEGVTRPVTSNLNFVAGQTVPNRVVVKVGTGGKVDFYNSTGTVDLIVDVGGYYTDPTPGGSGSRYTYVTPARLLDTRDGTGGFSLPVGPGGVIPLQVAGLKGVTTMDSATPPRAVALNVTVTNPTGASFLTAWPDGAPRPLASDLNYGPGQTVPNMVVVMLGRTGKVDLYNSAGSTDVIVDVLGWWG